MIEPTPEENQVVEQVKAIARAIDAKKGFNVVALDVRHSSSITNFILIAEGDVPRHVVALSQAVLDEMDKEGQSPQRVEGKAEGHWIVVDFVDIIVHLFTTEMRDKYALEGLWKESYLVDLNLMREEES